MPFLRLLAAAMLLLVLGAQAPKSVSEIVVAPLVVDPVDPAMRAAADGCSDLLVAALKAKGVAVARDPQLTQEKLQSASALWAVLGKLSRADGKFELDLRLLEVRSGDEMRAYFNGDKDPQLACRAMDKIAERIAVFVKEEK